jgi:hypothetical protein
MLDMICTIIVNRIKFPAFPRRIDLSSLLFKVEHVLAHLNNKLDKSIRRGKAGNFILFTMNNTSNVNFYTIMYNNYP